MITATLPAAPRRHDPLYKVTEALQAIMDVLDANGGEMSPEVESLWQEMQATFIDKAEGVALHILELKGLADRAKMESNRLAARRKTFETAADRLSDLLAKMLRTAGESNLKTHRVTMRIQRAGTPSIRWTGSDDTIPAPYRRTVTEVSLDGKAAIEAYRKGELDPQGFEIRFSESLVVK